MVWRRRVAQVTALLSAIAGVVFSRRVMIAIEAAELSNLHWDPRYIVLVLSVLWVVSAIALGFASGPTVRHLLHWALVVSASVSVGSGIVPEPYGFLLLVLTVAPVFSLPTIHAVVISFSASALITAATLIAGSSALWGIFAAAGLSLCAIALWLRSEFGEWTRKTALFDQASWAAAQYAKVNTSMLNRLDQSVEIARLRERERIAREVHDTVGYALTASLVQLRAARKLLDTSLESAEMRLVHVEEMVNDSLQDVRREVSNLRDESAVRQVGMSRWRRLCEIFGTSTGMRVSFSLPADLEVVSEEISETVYRIIQESLTNAYRHGGADHVDVSGVWRRNESRILLRVSDNGRGNGAVTPGNGLSGMRERVEELNGTLVWATKPGRGFDLGIELPWDGAVRVGN